MPRKRNRLSSILEKFAQEYELPYKIEGNDSKITIGITHRDKLISAVYQIDPSEDRYEFGASLGFIKSADFSDFAAKILTSKPIRGLTERIKSDKFMVVGSRSNLNYLDDIMIQKCFMDDIARVSTYYDQIRSQLKDE